MALMGVGDELLAAGQAERLYKERGAPVLIVDRHGRPRWHDIWKGNPAIIRPDDISDRSQVPVLLSAPNARPYIVYPFTAETGWTFNRAFRARDHVASIHLTDDELANGREIRANLGRYILMDSWSKHPNLRWPRDSWQEWVRTNPTGLPIIQQVYPGTENLLGVWLIETASFREACGLLASAAVYVRGESGMCHAAAALDVPNVAIWGGCMDWDVLGGYPRQVGVGISTPCCGSFKACEHCFEVMAGITPEMVWNGVERALRTA